jgi:hypothetical protein
VRGRITRRERLPRRLIDAFVIAVHTEPIEKASRRGGEGLPTRAAGDQRDAAERESGTDKASHRERHGDERRASDDGSGASRAATRFDPATDRNDVERLPLRG